MLPSRIIGRPRTEITYTVYDVSDPDNAVKLTATPVADAKYEDKRIEWGAKRCYAVRAAERVAGAIIESDASPAGVRNADRHVSARRAEGPDRDCRATARSI